MYKQPETTKTHILILQLHKMNKSRKRHSFILTLQKNSKRMKKEKLTSGMANIKKNLLNSTVS